MAEDQKWENSVGRSRQAEDRDELKVETAGSKLLAEVTEERRTGSASRKIPE